MEHVTDSIVEITTGAPADGQPLGFLPGQYVLIEDVAHRLEPRSYSIANPPRPDGSLSFLVTLVPRGQLSTWLHGLRPGDRISVSGPYGTFTAREEGNESELHLAAGSGLAPVRALIEAGLEMDPDRTRTLIFSARTESDVLDRSRFERWALVHPGFRFVRTLTRGEGPGPHGRVPALLGELCGELSGADVYISGGPGFVTSCTAAAEAQGADRVRIATEPFFVEPRPWGSDGIPAESPDDP